MIEINNRRYIGCKTKLMDYIKEEVGKAVEKEDYSFADIFAGTGIVGFTFAESGHPVIFNDNLYSNVVAYNAFCSDLEYREDVVRELIDKFNCKSYSEIEENYFSNVYGGKYFSVNDAKKIGYIRDYLEEHKSELKPREYYIILTSLLYATDKIANTVGHFESFLKKTPEDCNIQLQELNLKQVPNCTIYNEDANALSKHIEADVVYIDPPYNARQYVNFYHVLENLARWEKPTEFEGNSMKFKRNHLKSGYSRPCAPQLMKDLIDSLKCSLIVVSYNNTYDAKSGSSNNKIQEEELLEILSTKGEVKKVEIDYKGFNAGKTDFKNHKEYLFICKVK